MIAPINLDNPICPRCNVPMTVTDDGRRRLPTADRGAIWHVNKSAIRAHCPNKCGAAWPPSGAMFGR